MPEGTNSHTFEPQPSVAELLSTADVLYLNGLQLEEPTRELAEANLADDAEIVELGEQTISEDEYLYDFSFPEDGGKPNPHLWTNPPMALRYAEIVRDDLSARDPDNADYYAANYDAFAELIDELDAAMRESFATVPVRKLLTYHDAYAYFAEDYDWDVIGAIQVSDFEDPTPTRGRRADRAGRGRRVCRRSSGPRCSPARCSNRSAEKPASSTSTCCATTTCRASRVTPSTRGSG